MGGDLNNLYIRHRNSFFKFHDVEADGNCMYYCLAKCPATPLRSVEDIRRVLAKMMRKPSEHLLNFFVEYHKSDENPEPSLERWQNTVLKDTEWGSNFESSLFGAIYGVDIRIITNSPSGLEECDTRTLLEMYEVDSEKMIPKDAPTFYLYLHKHMNPHQPTQKPNHFAILDPIDYQPREGSVIYNHPSEQQVDGTTNHSTSTKESLEFDVMASNSLSRIDGNTSNPRFHGNGSGSKFDADGSIPKFDANGGDPRLDGSSSMSRSDANASIPRLDGSNSSMMIFDGTSSNGGMMSAQHQKRRRPRRPSEQHVPQRRNSLEMSALSNVLSEISTYDRAEVNKSHAKKTIQLRRSSMQDRKNWGGVMTEMEQHHTTSMSNILAAADKSARQEVAFSKGRVPQRRIERPEGRADNRDERSQSKHRRAPQAGESTTGRRSRPDRSSERKISNVQSERISSEHVHESNRESPLTGRNNQRSVGGKPKRLENSEMRHHNQEGDRIDPMREIRRSHRPREEVSPNDRRTTFASENLLSRQKGSNQQSLENTERSERIRRKMPDFEYNAMPSRGRDEDNTHSKTAKTQSTSRHTTAREEGSVSSQGSKSAASARPSTSKSRDEESVMSRDAQSGRRSRDDESMASRGSKVNSRRSRDDDSIKSPRPKAELDIPQHARTRDQMRRRDDDALPYSTPMRPSGGVDELRGRLPRQRTTIRQTASSKSPRRLTMSMQNDSNANSANDRRRTTSKSPRRLTMSVQNDSNANSPNDRRRTTSKSPRRSAMSMQNDSNANSANDRRRTTPQSQRRSTMSMQNDSNANSQNDRSPISSKSQRRSTMSMQSDSHSNVQIDRRQTSMEKQQRRMSSAPGNGQSMGSKSPRRSSMSVEHDGRRRVRSGEDDLYMNNSGHADETRSKIESSRSPRSNGSYAPMPTTTKVRTNSDDRQRRNSRRSMEMGSQSQYRPEVRSNRESPTRSEGKILRGTAAWAANIEGKVADQPSSSRRNGSPDRQNNRRQRATSNQPVPRHFEVYDSLE